MIPRKGRGSTVGIGVGRGGPRTWNCAVRANLYVATFQASGLLPLRARPPSEYLNRFHNFQVLEYVLCLF